MAEFFQASEVMKFAICIEENGEAFYRQAAKKFPEKKIVDMFAFLADEEVKHRRVFEGLLAKTNDSDPAESYPGEYIAYLKTYADELVFTKEKKGALVADTMKSVREAIDFAIGVEIDSILYYLEAKNVVPESQGMAIDTIIEEERRHYVKLVGIKKSSFPNFAQLERT